jgi:predicted ribosome quality control (RQC) complex YloA/Tae2 family protein
LGSGDTLAHGGGGGGGRGERPPPSDPESGIYQGRRVARIYTSPSGHTVLVGRSAEENDILSLKLARPRDVFFHVSGQPGSHVIVLVPESAPELDRDTLRFAASLAAAFSSARGARQVSVHYAPCSAVSKRRGQPPGEVMLREWRSVRVAPDRQEAWKRGADRPASVDDERGR